MACWIHLGVLAGNLLSSPQEGSVVTMIRSLLADNAALLQRSRLRQGEVCFRRWLVLARLLVALLFCCELNCTFY